MKCLKTVLLAIAGVFALIVVAAVVVVPPVAAAVYVDRSLGFGIVGGLIALGCGISITLGTLLGGLICLRERGQ